MEDCNLPTTAGCYLICAKPGLLSIRKGKQVYTSHYIGWSANIAARMKHHRAGTGAKLLAAFNRAGIHYEVVYIWEHQNGDYERKLHRRRSHKDFCPMCQLERNSGDGYTITRF